MANFEFNEDKLIFNEDKLIFNDGTSGSGTSGSGTSSSGTSSGLGYATITPLTTTSVQPSTIQPSTTKAPEASERPTIHPTIQPSEISVYNFKTNPVNGEKSAVTNNFILLNLGVLVCDTETTVNYETTQYGLASSGLGIKKLKQTWLDDSLITLDIVELGVGNLATHENSTFSSSEYYATSLFSNYHNLANLNKKCDIFSDRIFDDNNYKITSKIFNEKHELDVNFLYNALNFLANTDDAHYVTPSISDECKQHLRNALDKNIIYIALIFGNKSSDKTINTAISTFAKYQNASRLYSDNVNYTRPSKIINFYNGDKTTELKGIRNNTPYYLYFDNIDSNNFYRSNRNTSQSGIINTDMLSTIYANNSTDYNKLKEGLQFIYYKDELGDYLTINTDDSVSLVKNTATLNLCITNVNPENSNVYKNIVYKTYLNKLNIKAYWKNKNWVYCEDAKLDKQKTRDKYNYIDDFFRSVEYTTQKNNVIGDESFLPTDNLLYKYTIDSEDKCDEIDLNTIAVIYNKNKSSKDYSININCDSNSDLYIYTNIINESDKVYSYPAQLNKYQYRTGLDTLQFSAENNSIFATMVDENKLKDDIENNINKSAIFGEKLTVILNTLNNNNKSINLYPIQNLYCVIGQNNANILNIELDLLNNKSIVQFKKTNSITANNHNQCLININPNTELKITQQNIDENLIFNYNNRIIKSSNKTNISIPILNNLNNNIKLETTSGISVYDIVQQLVNSNFITIDNNVNINLPKQNELLETINSLNNIIDDLTNRIITLESQTPSTTVIPHISKSINLYVKKLFSSNNLKPRTENYNQILYNKRFAFYIINQTSDNIINESTVFNCNNLKADTLIKLIKYKVTEYINTEEQITKDVPLILTAENLIELYYAYKNNSKTPQFNFEIVLDKEDLASDKSVIICCAWDIDEALDTTHYNVDEEPTYWMKKELFRVKSDVLPNAFSSPIYGFKTSNIGAGYTRNIHINNDNSNENLEIIEYGSSSTDENNSRKYVDLGLSSGNKWCTQDLDANFHKSYIMYDKNNNLITNPDLDYGSLFAWASTKTIFTSTYVASDVDRIYTPDLYTSDIFRPTFAPYYNNTGKYYDKYNYSDKKTELDDIDNICKVRNINAHIPTIADANELINKFKNDVILHTIWYENNTYSYYYTINNNSSNTLTFPSFKSDDTDKPYTDIWCNSLNTNFDNENNSSTYGYAYTITFMRITPSIQPDASSIPSSTPIPKYWPQHYQEKATMELRQRQRHLGRCIRLVQSLTDNVNLNGTNNNWTITLPTVQPYIKKPSSDDDPLQPGVQPSIDTLDKDGSAL